MGTFPISGLILTACSASVTSKCSLTVASFLFTQLSSVLVKNLLFRQPVTDIPLSVDLSGEMNQSWLALNSEDDKASHHEASMPDQSLSRFVDGNSALTLILRITIQMNNIIIGICTYINYVEEA